MAKDPAFLFYPQDFLMGTIFFTDEQKGIYITLLCIQHQHGGVIKKSDFNKIAGRNKAVREKFVETEEGFYNARLLREMGARQKKSDNLSANAKKRWEIEKQKKNDKKVQAQMQEEEKGISREVLKPMPGISREDSKQEAARVPTENENENENIKEEVIEKISKRAKPPTRLEVKDYCKTQGWSEDMGLEFFTHYESIGWITAGEVPRPILVWERALEKWILRELRKEKSQVKERSFIKVDPEKVIKGSSLRRT